MLSVKKMVKGKFKVKNMEFNPGILNICISKVYLSPNKLESLKF
jgi:hypothetical protein